MVTCRKIAGYCIVHYMSKKQQSRLHLCSCIVMLNTGRTLNSAAQHHKRCRKAVSDVCLQAAATMPTCETATALHRDMWRNSSSEAAAATQATCWLPQHGPPQPGTHANPPCQLSLNDIGSCAIFCDARGSPHQPIGIRN